MHWDHKYGWYNEKKFILNSQVRLFGPTDKLVEKSEFLYVRTYSLCQDA